MTGIANRLILFLFIGLCLTLPVSSQVRVEEEMSTDSVDLFGKKSGVEKSGALAMTLNLILPGLGHYYWGNQKAACGFFSAEALFTFGMLACGAYSHDIQQSARSFALTYANIQGGPGANDFFWQNIGQTLDSKGFNQIQDLNRASDDSKYLTPELQWQWADDSYRIRYNDLLKKSVNYQVASNLFLGAMLLNRLVAFIDMRVASRHNGNGLLSTLRFIPQYVYATGANGMMCVGQF